MDDDYPTTSERAKATARIWLPAAHFKGDRVRNYEGVWDCELTFKRNGGDGEDNGHTFRVMMIRETDGKHAAFGLNVLPIRTSFGGGLESLDEKREVIPREWRLAVISNILERSLGLEGMGEWPADPKEIQPAVSKSKGTSVNDVGKKEEAARPPPISPSDKS